MSVYQKLRGTVEQLLQLAGTAGAQLKSNLTGGAAFETRNPTDTGFAIHRGADAVGADDFATKRQIDVKGYAPIRVPIALASVSSTTIMPAGARVFRAVLDVTTPYSAGTTITLGTPGTPAAFQAATDNSPLVANYWAVDQNTAVPGAPSVARATVAGGPAAGAADMLIFYDVPAP